MDSEGRGPQKGSWVPAPQCRFDGYEEVRRQGLAVKEAFNTSVGTVEVLVDEQSRIVSAYRFDAQQRPVAAAIESWDHTDLADLLTRQAHLPLDDVAQAHGGPAMVDIADRGEPVGERGESVSVADENVSSLDRKSVV